MNIIGNIMSQWFDIENFLPKYDKTTRDERNMLTKLWKKIRNLFEYFVKLYVELMNKCKIRFLIQYHNLFTRFALFMIQPQLSSAGLIWIYSSALMLYKKVVSRFITVRYFFNSSKRHFLYTLFKSIGRFAKFCAERGTLVKFDRK